MENEKLATELLHEIKASAKRWFIIALVELFIILGIVGGFIWYITLPVDESTVTTVENDDGNANYVGGNVTGVINNGETGESNSKED